jgi:ribosomal protein L16 Arg81 hydroxylase
MELGLSLADLVAPQSLSEFFENAWERDSRLAKIPEEIAENLMRPSDVQYLSYSLSACLKDWLRLVKDTRELPESLYITGEGLVDVAKVNSAYRNGYTIQLSKVHKRWLPVARLCRHLEHEFLASGIELRDRIGGHVYLTPPSAQGLGIHFDYMDVFVIQLAGEKRWKVWEWTDRLPVRQGTKLLPTDELPPLKWDLTLKKGDVLYIPRGVIHEACTTDQYSLHLSLSVYPATWTDLLLPALQASPLARSPIAPGVVCSEEKIAQAQTTLRMLLDQLAQPDALRRAISAVRSETLRRLDPLPADSMCGKKADQDSITLNTRLCRTSTPFVLCDEDGTVCLKWSEGVLKAGAANKAALSQLASTCSLDVRDILLKGEDARVALARQLIAAGLFMVPQ